MKGFVISITLLSLLLVSVLVAVSANSSNRPEEMKDTFRRILVIYIYDQTDQILNEKRSSTSNVSIITSVLKVFGRFNVPDDIKIQRTNEFISLSFNNTLAYELTGTEIPHTETITSTRKYCESIPPTFNFLILIPRINNCTSPKYYLDISTFRTSHLVTCDGKEHFVSETIISEIIDFFYKDVSKKLRAILTNCTLFK